MIYRFESFELDSDLYVLRRGGTPVKVEPRVLELLAYLLERRARLVTKVELLDSLWAGEFVTDAALTRCIYLARQALGESSKEQRLIRTVHGRGYQIGDGVEVVAEDGASARSREPSEAVASTAPTDSAPAPPAPDRTRRSRGMIALALGLLLIGAVVLLWQIGRRPGGPPGRDPPVRLGLLPLVAPAGSPELGLTALSIYDLLRQRLSALDDVLIRDIEGEDGVSTVELARAWGVDHLITGRVEAGPSQGSARLSLALRHVEPGGTEEVLGLGSFELPLLANGGLAEYVRVREAVAHAVVTSLTPFHSLPADVVPPPRHAEAYRLFLLAYQKLAGDFCANSQAVIELAERSLELDPGYAPTWHVLAAALINQVWACGETGTHHDRALEALEQAERLAPGSPTVASLRIDVLTATGRTEEALEAALRQVELHPRNPHAVMAEAYVLTHAGFLDRAQMRLQRVLELDPWYFSTTAYATVPGATLYLGRWDEFLDLVPSADSAYYRFYRGLALYLAGDSGAARAALQPAYEDSPYDVFGRLAQALLAADEGNREAAVALIDQLQRQRRAMLASDGEVTFKQAQILALAGAEPEALAMLRAAVDEGFFCHRCLELDPALDALRDDPELAAVIGQARSRHLELADRFGLEPE